MMLICHPAIKESKMEIKDAYKQKMEAQLKEWDAQINLLEAKVESAGADIKVQRAKQLHELRAKQRAASAKMKELGESSGAAWEQVKITADKIWDDLKAGVEAARSTFK
jgi:recombinational DNA repair ATPase RecF